MWHWYTKIFYWWYQKSLFINHDIKWKSSKNLNNLFREYSRHNIDNDELIFGGKISIMNRLKPLTCMCMVCIMRIIKIGWNIFPKRIFSSFKTESVSKKSHTVEMDKLQAFLGLESFIRKEVKGILLFKKMPITSNTICMGSEW